MVLNYESNSAENIVESYRWAFIEVHAKSFYTTIVLVTCLLIGIFCFWLCRKRGIVRWRRRCCNGCCSSGVGEEEEAERLEMVQLKKNVSDIMLIMENSRNPSMAALPPPTCPVMSATPSGSGDWVKKSEIKDFIALQVDVELAKHELEKGKDAKDEIYDIEQIKI